MYKFDITIQNWDYLPSCLWVFREPKLSLRKFLLNLSTVVSIRMPIKWPFSPTLKMVKNTFVDIRNEKTKGHSMDILWHDIRQKQSHKESVFIECNWVFGPQMSFFMCHFRILNQHEDFIILMYAYICFCFETMRMKIKWNHFIIWLI